MKNRIDRYIQTDIRSIPEYISVTSTTHKQIWKLMQNIYTEISKICVPKVLENRYIINSTTSIELLSRCIVDTSYDAELNKQIYTNIENNINKYLRTAVELELYEIAENLRRLKNVFA